jgi:hypothetical protein
VRVLGQIKKKSRDDRTRAISRIPPPYYRNPPYPPSVDLAMLVNPSGVDARRARVAAEHMDGSSSQLSVADTQRP